MISRRTLLAVPLAALAAPLPLSAATRPLRIYMILFRGETGAEKGFRAYFSDNHIDAEFIVRDVALDVTKVPAMVREARALKADLIYTWGTPVTLAVVGPHTGVDPARHVTDIPVVFTMVASPVTARLVPSMRSSGRNITGTSHVVPMDQQLSAMRAYRKFERVGIIYNPAEPNSRQNLAELKAAAAKDGFALTERPVPLDDKGQPVAAAIPALLEALARAKVQIVYIGPDSFIAANRKVFTETALVHRLPSFAATETNLRDGKALFGLVSGAENLGRLTADKAARILRQKTPPSAIPVETLARFSYLVNMQVAKELDFYPPLKVVNFAELLK